MDREEPGISSYPEGRREGRDPLPDHAGESPLLSRSGGDTGQTLMDKGQCLLQTSGPRLTTPPPKAERWVFAGVGRAQDCLVDPKAPWDP